MKSMILLAFVIAIIFYLDIGDATSYKQKIQGMKTRKNSTEKRVNALRRFFNSAIINIDNELNKSIARLVEHRDLVIPNVVESIKEHALYRRRLKEIAKLCVRVADSRLQNMAARCIEELKSAGETEKQRLSEISLYKNAIAEGETLIDLLGKIIRGTYKNNEMFKKARADFEKLKKTRTRSINAAIINQREGGIMLIGSMVDNLERNITMRASTIIVEFTHNGTCNG